MKQFEDYLVREYSSSRLLVRARVRFPVACWPAPKAQWSDPDSALGELDPATPREVELNARFAKGRMFNGEIYAMRRLRCSGRLRLDTKCGSYFDSLNTCEAMELELMEGVPGLPLRTGQPLMDGTKRCAAIGVATLLVLRERAGHSVVLAPIAAKGMPHRAGQLHVVPSGMLQPPYSVIHTVRTELSEELHDLDPPQDARIYFTGIAINLLNLRPEICTMVIVDRPPSLRLGAEFQPGARVVPFGSDAHLVRALQLHDTPITPPGAAALFLGARVLRQLLKP
ncbi:MAG TPA: hypothetical protein VGK29_05375 [Paludibaculum sp.]|jgi:hypothetical protein